MGKFPRAGSPRRGLVLDDGMCGSNFPIMVHVTTIRAGEVSCVVSTGDESDVFVGSVVRNEREIAKLSATSLLGLRYAFQDWLIMRTYKIRGFRPKGQ